MVKFVKKGEGTYLLDVTGYTCPYPVIYTRRALAAIKPGERLEVLTDNPPSCENVPSAARKDGHEVLGVERVGEGVWRIVIVKKR
ncbi:MAG: sulfurtransferase TusA family protein [Thermoproteota archaeon]